MEELAAIIARPLLLVGRLVLEVVFSALPDVLLFWCERKGGKAEKICKWCFATLLLVSVLVLAFALTGCATKHPECERADTFGHCQQWRGQPQTCERPDFLGFCPPSRH